MSLHAVEDTLGAVLIGSGFAAAFVIFLLPRGCSRADIEISRD